MTQYTTRDIVTTRLRLAERDEESLPLGGTVKLRELTRAEFRAAAAWSETADKADREQLRGITLAVAVQDALGQDDPKEALRRALTTYYLGAPENATDVDRWHAAIVAAGLLDGESGQPLFQRDEVLQWPARGAIWAEVRRLAQAILDLSEAGSEALKSGDPETPAE